MLSSPVLAPRQPSSLSHRDASRGSARAMPDFGYMGVASSAPSIVVTIGCQNCLLHAFVTSAPFRLDAPATMTPYASTLADVAVFAANEIAFDGGLVDANTLQLWLRLRLRGLPGDELA